MEFAWDHKATRQNNKYLNSGQNSAFEIDALFITPW